LQGYTVGVGSKTFDGVRFAAYTDDHLPPHVHGFYAGVEVILELFFEEKKVRLARRKDRIRPPNAKQSDVNYIVRVAGKHLDEIIELWEAAQ
jgi:Domain of unknown function (DUF4160)